MTVVIAPPDNVSTACTKRLPYKALVRIIGEYIISINTRVMKRPLVVEQERINFDVTD